MEEIAGQRRRVLGETTFRTERGGGKRGFSLRFSTLVYKVPRKKKWKIKRSKPGPTRHVLKSTE